MSCVFLLRTLLKDAGLPLLRHSSLPLKHLALMRTIISMSAIPRKIASSPLWRLLFPLHLCCSLLLLLLFSSKPAPVFGSRLLDLQHCFLRCFPVLLRRLRTVDFSQMRGAPCSVLNVAISSPRLSIPAPQMMGRVSAGGVSALLAAPASRRTSAVRSLRS